ncbi:MAG: FAD binding domain-containing protein [Gemmatimonadaceae bacterium]
MRAFGYQRPNTFAEAAHLLGDTDALPIGGGTDLLVSIDEGLASPRVVVDLRGIDGNDAIAEATGSLRIGGAVRVDQLARDGRVRDRFPALARACEAVGSPALRNMGTIAGNLCQRPRCWYLRRGIPCLKNGGTACPARTGENQYHAILDGDPCFIVHPSDVAVALTALDAELELLSRDGSRTVKLADFYVLPRERMDQETVLQPGEVVRAVLVPDTFSRGPQVFRKLIQRGAWDFALVSIAAARRRDGAVRIVLGGVAPRPWRVPQSIEEDVASGGLDEDSITALAERALYDAEPLSKNGYKLALAASLLRDAMRELGA